MQSKGKSIAVVLIVLAIGFIMGALTSGALQNRRLHHIRHMGPQERFEKMLYDIVEPNVEQRQELDRIFEKYALKMAAINDEKTIALLNEVDSLRTEVRSILTEEQKKRFQERQQTFYEHFVEMQLNRIDRAVNLTDEQKKEIRAIFEEHKAFFPDPLNGEKHPPVSDFKPQLEKLDQELERILSPEQYKEYRELKRNRRGGPGRGFFPERGGPPGRRPFQN